jgi:hypothetical protein
MAAEGTGDKLTPRGSEKARPLRRCGSIDGQRHTAIGAELTTLGEMPAAVTPAEMLWTRVWKSPPQRAAKDGVERVSLENSTAAKGGFSIFDPFLPATKARYTGCPESKARAVPPGGYQLSAHLASDGK